MIWPEEAVTNGIMFDYMDICWIRKSSHLRWRGIEVSFEGFAKIKLVFISAKKGYGGYALVGIFQ